MTRFTPTFPVAETPDDRMKRESFERAQQEETAGGFVENFFNRGQESAPAFLTRQIYRNTVFPDDPNFKLDEKFFEELTRGLPDSVWHRFTDARSMDQAYSIRNDLLQTQDRRQTLAASGMTGTAAAIFADLVEPSNLALGLATGGISNLSRLNAARRLSLMAEEGKITGDAFKAAIAAASRANATTVATEAALGAVGFGGIEAYKATQDPFTTAGDVIAGSLGGLGFGAASEALAGLNRFTRAPMVGLAGAVGPGFVQAAQGVESDQINESFWLAFAQGAAFSLAHGKRGPLLDKLTMDTYAAAADAWKVQEADILRNIQDDYLTDTGRRVIEDADAILARTSERVRQTIDGPEVAKTTEPVGTPVPRDPAPEEAKAAKLQAIREIFAKEGTTAGGEQGAMGAWSAKERELQVLQEERRAKKIATDFDASRISDVPEPALAVYKEFNIFGKTYRVSLGGMTAGDIVGGSKIQTFRDLAARMTHDPIPRDGNHTYYDAMTSKTKKIGARDAKIERAMSDAYAKHAEYAKGRGEKPLARDHFFEAAGVHRVRGLSSPDPGIEAARTASTAFYNDTLAMRKRFGDADAEATPEDATYMERVYNAPVIRDLTLAAVPGEIERALAEFTISATPDMDPRVAALMGRAAAKRGRNADQHFADPTHDIVRLPASELVDALKNELGDLLKPEDIALVEGHIKSKADKASGDANRKRIGMDYNHPVDIRLKDGTTKTITLTDLLVNNLENNLHSNNHRSESMAHFYDVMKATFPNNEVRTITAFERRLHQLAEETGDTAGKHTGDIEKLVAMGKNVLGVPQYQSNPVVRGMRALRNIGSFLGLTNVTSGLTQIPEATDAMSFAGSRAVAKLMPELPKIIKEVAAGKYENADLRAMLDGGSAALSMWNDRIHRNLDFEASGPASAAELGIKKGTQFGLTYFSGVRPMQAGLESFAGYGVLYSFSDRAFNPDRAFTDLDLRDMGLTPDEYKAINAQIVKYGDAESLSIGREKWDDPEAIGAFHRAFDLTTRRLVLSRDASDLPHWAANTAWGQTLAQFRSFSLMAWRNKTMYGVHRFRNGDASYANRLLLTSAANAVVYAANVGLRGLGKPDAGEWYEDKLSPEEVLKASFSRAAYASIIPMAIDTISSRAGYGDVFSGARTTELRGGLLDGNPTYNYLNNLWHAPSSIIGPMLPGNDYRFSKRDAIRLRDLVLPNVLGVRNAIEHLIEDLPATPEQARK